MNAEVGPLKLDNQKYAGFGVRFLAYWVDSVITTALIIVVGYVMNAGTGYNPLDVFNAASSAEMEQLLQSWEHMDMLALAIGAIYHIFLWVNYDGATPGKKLLAIKVVQTDGKKVSYASAIVRYVGYFLSSFVLLLGYMWVLWDKKKQGWHDKLARTTVIHTGERPNTLAAVVIAIVAIIGFVSYFGALGVHSFKLSFSEELAKEIVNQAESGGAESDSGQVYDRITFASRVFEEINAIRADAGLAAIEHDQKLCAYATRRIDQIEAYGGFDDGQGFYEDSANPSIWNAYFYDYSGGAWTMASAAEAFDDRTVDAVVNHWINIVEESSAMTPEAAGACISADRGWVIIAGGDR